MKENSTFSRIVTWAADRIPDDEVDRAIKTTVDDPTLELSEKARQWAHLEINQIKITSLAGRIALVGSFATGIATIAIGTIRVLAGEPPSITPASMALCQLLGAYLVTGSENRANPQRFRAGWVLLLTGTAIGIRFLITLV